jgi:glycosyltransferase involved in cell wall biosynthesis
MFCGGQGIYAARLAGSLRALGHEVHVISGPPLPELDAGVPLHAIPNLNFFGQSLRAALPRDNPFQALRPGHLWELGTTRLGVFPEMTAFGLRLALRWKALQRRHRFDVVLDNQSLTWGLLAIQSAGVPVVGVIHHPLHIDREADFALDPGFYRRWRRTLYFPLLMQGAVAPRLTGILTVSHASRREIQRHFGIPAQRIAVVHNGTDTEMFQPLPGPKDIDLIFVGRTEDRKKGIPYLLEALARTPEHIRLKIVDGRIPDDGLVPRKLRELDLGRRVVLVRRMLGLRELVEQYASARIAVVPSYFEGFGFPASEAMAAGLPVIASDRGALPEVVGRDGQCGRIVPFGDVGALAAAITDLAALPRDTLAKMGEAARRRVLREFDWRRCAARTAAALGEFARAHRRPRPA